MNNERPPQMPARPVAKPLLSREGWVALVGGALMGQVVVGISAHHPGSLFGLVVALIYVLSASSSLVMFMLSWPSRPADLPRSPCVHAWLGLQGLGLLASLHASSWF